MNNEAIIEFGFRILRNMMKNYADRGGYYPPRLDNTLRDL